MAKCLLERHLLGNRIFCKYLGVKIYYFGEMSSMSNLTKKLGSLLGAAFTIGILPLTVATKAHASDPIPPNIVVNGSFETTPTTINNPGVAYYNAIPGWSLDPNSQGGFQGPAAIEIQRNIAGTPFDGQNLLELDSHGVSGIFQDLTTVVGQTYKLEFAFSPRPQRHPRSPIFSWGTTQNILNVKWGNDAVDTLTRNGAGLTDTEWKVYTYDLVATSTTTRLSFNNFTERSDTFGTYLDKVSVRAVTVPEPATMVGILAVGAFGIGSLRKRQQPNATAKA
jgi:hypothetical protein